MRKKKEKKVRSRLKKFFFFFFKTELERQQSLRASLKVLLKGSVYAVMRFLWLKVFLLVREKKKEKKY